MQLRPVGCMPLAMTNAQILAHEITVAVRIVASKDVLGSVCKDQILEHAVLLSVSVTYG